MLVPWKGNPKQQVSSHSVFFYIIFIYLNLLFVSFVDEQREGTNKPIQQRQQWKLCRVKDILANLQRYFEQYNAYLLLSTDLPERGKTSEQTGI